MKTSERVIISRESEYKRILETKQQAITSNNRGYQPHTYKKLNYVIIKLINHLREDQQQNQSVSKLKRSIISNKALRIKH
jgi:hypothetical protein